MNTLLRKVSDKPPKINGLKRERIRCYFKNTWELYECLFSAIKEDGTFYLSPDPLRNPLVFYLGHTAAFYINKLKLVGLIEEGVNPRFDQLFAIGVDPESPENLEVSDYWPSVREVRDYRREIYNVVLGVIDNADLGDGCITPESPLWALLMGMEHDRIHFETSSVLIRQLPVDLVEIPEGWIHAQSLGDAPRNEWIEMAGGDIYFGKPLASDIYGWDNEYGSMEVNVKPFKATKNLISNQEYLAFVNAGGYATPDFWTGDAWDWKTRNAVEHPKFWMPSPSGYRYRRMFDEVDMPMDFPAEVNAYEAEAYCRWKGRGCRLLSEAEFLFIARENTKESDDPAFSDKHNLHFSHGSPTPVGSMREGRTASGFNDIYGNVWDWLKDDFYPLENFKIDPLYEDFSAPYMDSEHGMMAGGSWATTGTGASKYYRLWFRRHFYQHAGFRLAKSLD